MRGESVSDGMEAEFAGPLAQLPRLPFGAKAPLGFVAVTYTSGCGLEFISVAAGSLIYVACQSNRLILAFDHGAAHGLDKTAKVGWLVRHLLGGMPRGDNGFGSVFDVALGDPRLGWCPRHFLEEAALTPRDQRRPPGPQAEELQELGRFIPDMKFLDALKSYFEGKGINLSELKEGDGMVPAAAPKAAKSQPGAGVIATAPRMYFPGFRRNRFRSC